MSTIKELDEMQVFQHLQALLNFMDENKYHASNKAETNDWIIGQFLIKLKRDNYIFRLSDEDKTYTVDEVWDLYRNDKDFSFTSFSDFTKSNGFVFIKAPEKEAMEHEVTRLQNIGIAMANDIEDNRNKIMLLKKAIIRMVAEFETDTPVVPNQKKALEYANGLLLKMMNE